MFSKATSSISDRSTGQARRRSLRLGHWFLLWMLLVSVTALGVTLTVVLGAQYHDLEHRLEQRARAAARAAASDVWNESSAAIVLTSLPELVAAEVRTQSGSLVWQYGVIQEADREASVAGLLRIVEQAAAVDNRTATSSLRVELILSTRQVIQRVVATGARLALSLLIVLALGVVAGTLLINRVVEPLDRLAGLVAVFDPDHPVDVPDVRGAGREVAELAAAFQRMQDRLGCERRALAASELRYRELFESSPVALLEADRSGRILGANLAAELFLGNHAEPASVADFAPAVAESLKGLGAKANEINLESSWSLPDGNEVEVDIHIQALPAGGRGDFLIAVRDLSDRVRRLGERWQKTLDEMPEGVALLDPEERPLQSNRSFADFAGAVLPEISVPGGIQERREWTVAAGERTLRCVLAPVSDAGERVLVVRDETEWLRAEALLRENQKMEAVASLAGGVAHDFNNLLAGILLHIRLVEKDPTAIAESVATIRALAEEGAEVVKGMLDFARPVNSPRAAVDLVRLVRDQEAMLRHMLPPRTTLEVVTQSHAAPILADASDMRRILLNLVLNARDAIANARGSILVRVEQAGTDVELEVADDGPGVPAAQRDRIFEPFFSLRRDGRGAGLGLAVTYALTKEHDGNIVHRPVDDGGASFLVTFPALVSAEEET